MINIRIDDEPFEVLPPLTMAELLRIAGVDVERHYLCRVVGNSVGEDYRLPDQEVPVQDGDKFVTNYTGPATAQ